MLLQKHSRVDRNLVGRYYGNISPHCSGTLRKDCNIVNNTICLATTLLVIRVVIGSWKKGLVLSIQIQVPRQCWIGITGVSLLLWLCYCPYGCGD